jgi:hypothetical protein
MYGIKRGGKVLCNARGDNILLVYQLEEALGFRKRRSRSAWERPRYGPVDLGKVEDKTC